MHTLPNQPLSIFVIAALMTGKTLLIMGQTVESTTEYLEHFIDEQLSCERAML